MAKRYTFGGVEYENLQALRAACPRFVFPDGADAALLAGLGIGEREVQEPEPEADSLALAKLARRDAVAAISVEVDGLVFDGNEAAQRRMLATLATWPEDGNGEEAAAIPWVLADNTLAQVRRAQLKAALGLAVARMRQLWTRPYAAEAAHE